MSKINELSPRERKFARIICTNWPEHKIKRISEVGPSRYELQVSNLNRAGFIRCIEAVMLEYTLYNREFPNKQKGGPPPRDANDLFKNM